MIVYASDCCKLLQKAVKAMKFAVLGIKMFLLATKKKKNLHSRLTEQIYESFQPLLTNKYIGLSMITL